MLVALVFSLPANANSQELATCFIDSLNGKERKQLVKWIFLSMAAHPDLVAYSSVSEEDRLKSDKTAGELVTRLFVENCPSQAKKAQKADPLAIQKAFEVVGQVAVQELMTNNTVTQAIINYANYADVKKIHALLSE